MAQPRRLLLQELLEQELGSTNVYFQPPPTVQMQYPAIVYHRDFSDTQYADNLPYKHTKRYKITVLDRDPDSDIPDRIAALPTAKFMAYYSANQLNHYVYNLHF